MSESTNTYAFRVFTGKVIIDGIDSEYAKNDPA
jgi:hypothetical protein